MEESFDIENIKLTKIYALSSSIRPNYYRYIGKTDGTLKNRLKGHIYEALKKKDTKNYKINWIRSELANHNNIVITLIDEVTRDQWEESEKYYIQYYKSRGARLTNLTEGGNGKTGTKVYIPKEEKIRETIKRRKRKPGRPKKEKPPKKKDNRIFFINSEGKKQIVTLGMLSRMEEKERRVLMAQKQDNAIVENFL